MRSVRLKRPLSHHFIIVSYIATPIINLLLVSLSLGIPLGAAASRVLAGYGPLVAAWLATAPVAGACLYLLNRASWYIFLVHAGIILAGAVMTLGLHWLGDVSAIPRLSQAVFLAGNVMRIAFVGYVLQKDFRAPYFHILQRSFRATRRLSVTVSIILDGEACQTEDLSAGGCFVARPAPKRGAGERLGVRLDCGVAELRCEGQVMRSSPDGLGVRFIRLSRRDRLALRLMIARRMVRRQQARG
jgi:hypothetical protein